MLRILSFFLLIIPVIGYGQTFEIQLPNSIVADTVPKTWRGSNHSAFSDLYLFNNPEFTNLYPKLHPGIIRWPAGNRSQNYEWKDHLNITSKFNLKNVIPFLSQFDVDLQVVTNFGNSSALESAELVSFCNNTNSFYANMRDSLLGNSNPINVKYWEIGNESNTQWAFAWSWLGYQALVRYTSGATPKSLSREAIDRLYYYGGEFFREGWVAILGGLDLKTAILGDQKFYPFALSSDTITVSYPKLDTLDLDAVRVYKTPNFDLNWAMNLGITLSDIQALYDSIANPYNLLSASEYTWNEEQVIVSPNGGINTNDIILVEYNSTGHDGAFAYRDAMKAADQTIEIGYVVELRPELYNDVIFQQDFANSPPDFMVGHSYPSNNTLPLAQDNLYSEIVYEAKKEIDKLVDAQTAWDQRAIDWNITNDIGYGVTEWNISLYDNAPADHPHRGISGGLYVASLWANLFEKSLQNSIDLRVNNHFALVASGSNFIHLFHDHNTGTIETSVEGKATTMVMESIGEFMFPVTLTNMPQIQIKETNQVIFFTIDAIEKWGGISSDGNYIHLLLINRNDEQDYDINVHIPNTYQADSVSVEKLYGTMIDEEIFTDFQKYKLINNDFVISLPPFSLTFIKIHINDVISIVDDDMSENDFTLFPNPANSKVHIHSKNENYSLTIYNQIGQIIYNSKENHSSEIDINYFSKGLYYFSILTNQTHKTYKILVQ